MAGKCQKQSSDVTKLTVKKKAVLPSVRTQNIAINNLN